MKTAAGVTYGGWPRLLTSQARPTPAGAPFFAFCAKGGRRECLSNLTNPQTLNLYSMVADDPESFADLDGHVTTPGQEAQTACATNQQCADNKNGQADDKKTQNKPPTAAEKKTARAAKRHAIAQRIVLAVRGVLDLKLGVEKIGAAAAAGVSTPVTGPLGAAGAAYGAISGTGQTVQGGAEIVGAITGNVKEGGWPRLLTSQARPTPAGAPFFAFCAKGGRRECLSSISYSGNGNILSATDTVNGTWSSYQYDDFNRLISSSCTAGCPQSQSTLAFSYTYDRYGNRWSQTVTAGGGTWNQPSYTFDANNRINTSGFTFDAAGNIINDSIHSYTYDAENRIVKVDAGSTATYAYDAEGRRVAKTAGAGNFEYLFDLGGRAVTELVAGTATTNRTEAYAGGRHLATQNVSLGTSYFIHSDWLGTERARTNLGNTVFETCTGLPYGDSLSCTGTDISPLHFTGKMRDAETGLDEFPARYYSSTQGRWYSPDWASAQVPVPYADLHNPQSLNLYDYVGGDPTNHADADGHTNPPGQEANNACAGNQQCAANQQDGAQNKPGFWSRLGQRIKNGFTGHGFKTNEQFLPEGTVTTIQGEAYVHEPKAAVTAATDAAGIVAAVKDVKGLGYASAAVSLANDRSPQNITINVLGLIPGFDVPIAINGAFIDAFDHKMHQDTPGHDKSNVIPTNICEEGACVANPDLQPNGGWTN